MSYLVVAAHPDDEVLGAGATIYRLTQKGEKVSVCILCGNAEARAFHAEDSELHADMERCMDALGISEVITGSFPNIKMNTVPHLELVQFIENAILKTNADTVITHHPSDLNNDHVQTSLACQEAVRLFQRREGVVSLKELLYMEVPSSTEWALDASASMFRPNTYVEVGLEAVEMKLKALSQYKGVMRAYPHPRSAEAVTGLAAYRGAASGCCYAEAFESAMRRIPL